jgi:glycerol-1-phosphate dehydrogenase [NAD(P)+]
MVRAGIGDVVSNLSAIADWELAAADRGEPVDGLAVTLARTAAQAVLHQPGTVTGDEFLTVLAESLVLSGIAMTVAGSSRPCSGGDHEILHAIDQLYPGAGTHGELAGLGALFCTYLRGDERLFGLMSACLARHELPRAPADLGLGPDEFTQAVLHAPATRPGRYTILERLELDERAIARQVAGFTAAVTGGG